MYLNQINKIIIINQVCAHYLKSEAGLAHRHVSFLTILLIAHPEMRLHATERELCWGVVIVHSDTNPYGANKVKFF